MNYKSKKVNMKSYQAETATKLLKENKSILYISEVTGLTIDEIQILKANL